jgi:uncharacterized protein
MRLFLWLLLSLAVLPALEAKDPPRRPVPPRLVNDFAGMLTPGEVAALEAKLVAYNDSTSTQIAIVIEPTLAGEDIFDYSLRLASAWGVGQKGNDNGILLFIAAQDRQLYIQTGYGAEGFLPDALAKRIIENVIKPAFRQGQYYAGLNEAVTVMMKLGAGEYSAEQVKGGDTGIPWGTIIFFFFLFIILSSIFNKNKRRNDDDEDGGYGRGGRYDMNPRPGGGWVIFPGGGGGGGGGWGGGGGGGFGGFGGGGFGGGGAGGSW